MPDIICAHVETPTLQSQLGARGVGEAGTAGTPGAVMNAINDALAPLKARVSRRRRSRWSAFRRRRRTSEPGSHRRSVVLGRRDPRRHPDRRLQGRLGGGAGGVATPLIALVISPAQGAAIMLPVLCVMDLAGLKAYLGLWDRRIMRIIVPADLLGCAIGMLSLLAKSLSAWVCGKKLTPLQIEGPRKRRLLLTPAVVS